MCTAHVCVGGSVRNSEAEGEPEELIADCNGVVEPTSLAALRTEMVHLIRTETARFLGQQQTDEGSAFLAA